MNNISKSTDAVTMPWKDGGEVGVDDGVGGGD